MDVSGPELHLSFSHVDGDYHYPILVDPAIEDYDWSGATPARRRTRVLRASLTGTGQRRRPHRPPSSRPAAERVGILNQAQGQHDLCERRLLAVDLARTGEDFHPHRQLLADTPRTAGHLRQLRHLHAERAVGCQRHLAEAEHEPLRQLELARVVLQPLRPEWRQRPLDTTGAGSERRRHAADHSDAWHADGRLPAGKPARRFHAVRPIRPHDDVDEAGRLYHLGQRQQPAIYAHSQRRRPRSRRRDDVDDQERHRDQQRGKAVRGHAVDVNDYPLYLADELVQNLQLFAARGQDERWVCRLRSDRQCDELLLHRPD